MLPGMLITGLNAATGTVDVVYRDVDGTNGATSSRTYTAMDLGTAASDRRIIVGVGSRAASAITVTSVTVQGISATQIVAVANGNTNADIWLASVPTGTTGDVVITFSASSARQGCAVWSMTGASSGTAHDTGSSTAANPTDTINCPANGAIVGFVFNGTNSGTSTWTGITEDIDLDIGPGSSLTTGASLEFATTQTGLAVTCTLGTSSAPAGVFASWGP